MGVNVLAVLFAVVVIGGLNSLLGAIVAGISLGVIEGLTKVFSRRRRARPCSSSW